MYNNEKIVALISAYQDLSTALHVHGGDEYLGECWVEGELNHLSPEGDEGPSVVQCSQDPQLVH